MIRIKQNISLKAYNTFGIDVKASHFLKVKSDLDLVNALKNNKLPLFVLSGGSNMLLTKNIEALVLHINTKGISIVEEKDTVLITSKAGENWHDFVQFCISKNYGGIENLSLIPGYVGSSPIQNIGAYGVEIKDSFVSCKALNIKTLLFEEFSNSECKFGYRDSIFKSKVKDQYIITEVTFRLTKGNHILKTNYGVIKAELEKNNIVRPTIKDISNAVISIRKSKLPDPNEVGNSGSFFKNPVISIDLYNSLKEEYPLIPSYPIDNNKVKVPAGWLIDQAGFKGHTYKNAGVHEKQALVLINKTGNTTGEEVLELAKIIQKKIFNLYSITLEREVNVF